MSAHSLNGEVQEVGKFARAVVAKRVLIIAAIPTALTLLAVFGIRVGDEDVTRIVVAVLDVLGLLGGITYATAGVTPADQSLQPVNSDGQALVPDPAAADAFEADQTPDPALTVAFEADAQADPAGFMGIGKAAPVDPPVELPQPGVAIFVADGTDLTGSTP